MTGESGRSGGVSSIESHGDDLEEVRDAVERLGPRFLLPWPSDRLAADGCVERLSRPDPGSSPWMRLACAVALASTAERLADGIALIEEIRRLDDPTVRAAANLVRGNLLLTVEGVDAAAPYWDEAREPLPEDDAVLTSLAMTEHYRGRLEEGLRLAGEGLAQARLRDARDGEAAALVAIARLAFFRGDFSRAERSLEVAEDVVASVPGADSRLGPLACGSWGALHAVRGDWEGARRAFEDALDCLRASGDTRSEGAVRSLRAELFAEWDHRLAHADARRALDLLRAPFDRCWRVRALRGQAVAAVGAGNAEAAIHQLEALADEPFGPMERGQTLLGLGRARRRSGDEAGAAAALEEAAGLFEGAGADYLLVAALAGLAEVGSGGCSDDLLERARRIARADPAYEVVLRAPGRLSIRLLGAPRVEVDEQEVRFPTWRAELLVYMLALAGPSGLDWLEVAARLWPEATEKLARGRLRTTLWEARTALGREGDRLRRRGERLLFDDTGIRIDLRDLCRRAERVLEGGPTLTARADARRLLGELSAPLLSPWGDEPWVADADEARRASLDVLRRFLTVPDGS